MTDVRELTRDQLRKEIKSMAPEGLDVEEALAGVVLSQTPASERTLPLIRNPFGKKSLYAWSEDDASVVKLALELLGQLVEGVAAGQAGLVNLGMGLKEIVCFLIDLRRHGVWVTDPLQIKILLSLHDADTGLTLQQLRDRLSNVGAPATAEILAALHALEHADAKSGPKPLVRADMTIWKSLV